MEKGILIKSSAQEQKHDRALAILKETMLQISMGRNPHSQRESLQRLINARLPCLVPYPLYTPNHPPYAQMIITALQELKKQMGSSKVSISSFIKSMHQDLPLAHEHLLTHHLERLVEVGEIISVKSMHTLYTLPSAYSTNSNKQQEGEQLRLAGGETVRGEMSSYGVDKGPVPQPEKCPMTLIEPESVGGDDGGTKLQIVVTESADFLQTKLTKRGRGRPPKERMSLYGNDGLAVQPKKCLMALAEPESVDGGTKHQDVITELADFLQTKLTVRGRGRPRKERSSLYTNDGLVVQPNKCPMTLVEPGSMVGDDSGTKHTEVPTEPVDSLLNKLTVRGRGRPRKERSSLYTNDDLAVQPNKCPMTLAEPELMGGDDSGTEHTEVPIEPVDSLLNKLTVRGRGRPRKERSSLYTNDGLVVQPNKCPMTLVEPESMGGDYSGTKHMEVPNELVDSLPNKLTVQSKAVVVYAVPNDDDPTVGYHSPVPQLRGRGRPAKKKFKIKYIQQL